MRERKIICQAVSTMEKKVLLSSFCASSAYGHSVFGAKCNETKFNVSCTLPIEQVRGLSATVADR